MPPKPTGPAAIDEEAGAKFTVSGGSVLALLGYAKSRGISGDGVLEAVGLTFDALVGPEARVSQAANDLIYETLAKRSRDPDFGLHFGEHLDLEGFHVLGHLAAHSATLGEAFERIAAHSRLLHDSGRVVIERDADATTVHPGCHGLLHTWPRHIAEFAATSVMSIGRRITGRPFVAERVTFRHPAPERVAEHVRIFGVLPEFGHFETAVVLSNALMELPVLGRAAGLVTYLDAYARDVIARMPHNDDLVTQVHRAVAVEIARRSPEIEEIASQLGMTARTLQRRLAEHGTTFQAVSDAVRRSFAERYLGDASLSLQEVAFLVGFADPSNFHRAFRRWTGATPAEYRKTKLSASASA